MTLAERDQSMIWHPYTQMQTTGAPIGIVRGEGSWLIAEDGTRYLDMISSWWVNIHGHAHPYIAEKVSRQLTVLEHVIFAGFTHEPAIAFAEMLLKILPGQMKKVFYSDNGSTAVEVALKMSVQYWHNQGTRKTKIIAFRNGYHGDTFGAMAVGDRSIFTQAFHDMLFEVLFVDVPVPGKEEQSIESFKDILSKHDDIAAFIFEPLVQGTAGMVMYSPGSLDEMINLCRQHRVHTIADEVMTGFGRTGKIFATDYLENKPDIICLSKGITGGTTPLGVTVCTADIFNAFLSEDKTKAFFHGHSYTANPLACAAAIASMELLLKPGCQDQLEMINRSHTVFKDQIEKHEMVADTRITGTILAIELETPGGTSYFNNLRDYIYAFFIERHILMRPLGNIIYILPPYCTTKEQLALTYNAIEELLDKLKTDD
jgi:adenosylmethionine-8-amino-7-oxononanoate aminotransferase